MPVSGVNAPGSGSAPAGLVLVRLFVASAVPTERITCAASHHDDSRTMWPDSLYWWNVWPCVWKGLPATSRPRNDAAPSGLHSQRIRPLRASPTYDRILKLWTPI